MKITYAPLQAGEAVQFTVHGFPEEEKIRLEIEHFYKNQPDETGRKFVVYNTFKEPIFSGLASGAGDIASFVVEDRERKQPSQTEKKEL